MTAELKLKLLEQLEIYEKQGRTLKQMIWYLQTHSAMTHAEATQFLTEEFYND